MDETDSGGASAAARRAAVADFAAALRHLRLEAGKPSFRAMAGATGAISHTTLHEAASGSRLPSWPTTKVYVQACGGSEAEWHQRWIAAARSALVQEAADSQAETAQHPTGLPTVLPHSQGSNGGTMSTTGDPEDSAARAPESVLPEQRRDRAATVGRTARRRHLWPHAVTLVVGALIGASAVQGRPSPQNPGVPEAAQDCPVAGPEGWQPAGFRLPNPAGPAAAAPALLGSPAAAPAASPSWVARSASDAQVMDSTGVVVPFGSPVQQGDALIITVMLTSTCPGTVIVTDTQGDRFQTVGDETDTRRHRVLVIAAFGVRPHSTADSIHLSYPHASKYHVAVDEYRGITTATRTARAHGESGGTTFSTSSAPVMCAPGALVVSAIGTNTGSAPAFSTGWTTLPALKLSSYRLTTAYQVITTTAPCVGTGTTTSQWSAVMAEFH